MVNKQIDFTQFQYNPLRFIFFVMKQNKWLGIWAIICIILGRLLQSGSFYFIKLITNAFGALEINRIYLLLFVFLGMIFMSTILYHISGFISLRWIAEMEAFSAQSVMNYLFSHSARYFFSRLSGNLQNKIFNISSAINAILPTLLWNLFNTALQLIVLTGSAFLTHWIMSMMFVFFVFISVIFNILISFKTIKYSKETANKASKARGLLVDIISNILATKQNTAIKIESKKLVIL